MNTFVAQQYPLSAILAQLNKQVAFYRGEVDRHRIIGFCRLGFHKHDMWVDFGSPEYASRPDGLILSLSERITPRRRAAAARPEGS